MFVFLFTDCKILLLKVLHACTSFTKSRWIVKQNCGTLISLIIIPFLIINDSWRQLTTSQVLIARGSFGSEPFNVLFITLSTRFTTKRKFLQAAALFARVGDVLVCSGKNLSVKKVVKDASHCESREGYKERAFLCVSDGTNMSFWYRYGQSRLHLIAICIVPCKRTVQL